MSRDAFQRMFIVGVEDGSFQKGIEREAILAFVLLKGLEIKSVNFAKITVDGLDATEKVIKTLRAWKFEAVMLAGISFAGFNLIDPTTVYEEFKRPIIIIARKKPDNKAVKRALQRHFEDWHIRWSIFEKLGLIHKVTVLSSEPPVYVEVVGTDALWASSLVKALSVCGRIPEPIRVARLIARGLS
ncbi:MAG: DUF99 family protein [Candidatus Bathyarchaeia archaeon]